MEVNLTPVQFEKITSALKEEFNRQQEFINAKERYLTALNHRKNMLSMLYEFHSIDASEISHDAKIEVRNGKLIIP